MSLHSAFTRRTRYRENGKQLVFAIPDDITSDIFLLLLQEILSDIRNLYEVNWLNAPRWPSRREAPLNIAQVCRAWRWIALSTRGLWSTFFIGQLNSWTRNGLPAKALDYWLSLSGCRDLKVSVFTANAHDLPYAWQKLQENLQSCSEVSFRLDDLGLMKELFESLPRATSVRSLSISVCPSMHSMRNLSLTMPTLPELQQLTVRTHLCTLMLGFTFFRSLQPPTDTLHKLSSLTLDQRISWTKALQWVTQCPNLTFVCVNVSEFVATSEPARCTLPYLRHIDISIAWLEETRPEIAGCTFDHITCPMLQTLSTWSPNSGGHWAEKVIQFLERSANPLSKLKLWGSLSTQSLEIVHLLEKSGSITELRLDKGLISSVLIDALTPKEKNGQTTIERVPRLSLLDVRIRDNDYAMISPLLDAVCTRWELSRKEIGAGLPSNVAITSHEKTVKRICRNHKTLRRCCDEGLELDPPISELVKTFEEKSLYSNALGLAEQRLCALKR